MKVLFVINQLFKGGAETALVNLIAAMPPEKYQIDLLIYDQSIDYDQEPRIQNEETTVFSINDVGETGQPLAER